jgi:tetratricopeptide (TPR) repeat protein
MGYAHGQLKQHTEAIAAYDKAIAIKPDYAIAYHNRAVSLYSRRDYDKAWADVKACRQRGGTIPEEFLAKLRRASPRED